MTRRIAFTNRSLFKFTNSENHSKKESAIGLGVDFGTSNSTAAFFDGQSIIVIKIDNRTLLPSATYLNKSFRAVTGQAAIDEYIQRNIGRRVELIPVSLGEGRTNTGSYDDTETPQLATTHAIYGKELEDFGLPGRLLYGVKQLLADEGAGEIKIFNKQYKLEALITPILLKIHKSLVDEAKQHIIGFTSFSSVTIGHPVNFEKNTTDESAGNILALERLGKAYVYAGFGTQKLCSEPVGAAISYLSEKVDVKNETILVVDFGGGTLDFCILKVGEQDFDIKVTYGIGLGGNHIDQKLFQELIFPLIGKGVSSNLSTLSETENRNFYFSEYETLLINWPISHMLNQNEYLTPIQNIIRNSENERDKAKLQRLMDLIQFNYSYIVLQHLKKLKEILSFKSQAVLDIPELDINITVTQDQFTGIIHDFISQFELAIKSTLKKVNLESASIDRVICVGGSSQIPAMQGVLQKYFPDRVEDHEIFTSVAAGLAVYDYFS